MRKIEENIFCRVFKSYEKKNEDGRFSASLYLVVIYIFLFTSIYGIMIDLLYGLHKNILKFIEVGS